MQNDILFDNIYIGHSVEDARKLAEETFFEKHPIEQLAELAEKPKDEDKPKSPSDLKFLDDPVFFIKEKLDLFLTIAAQDPIQAIKFVPEVAGGIGAILVSVIAIIVGLVSLGGSSAPPAVKKAAADAKDLAADAKDKVAAAASSGAEAVKDTTTKRATRSQS